MKLGGGVFRHTKQHVSDVTDGPDTTVWHRRMLEMGACRGTYESAVCGVGQGSLWQLTQVGRLNQRPDCYVHFK